MEQLSAMMTKNIAMTLIRSVFLLAHATLRAEYDYPVPIKAQGRWQSPVPSQWQQRAGVTIKVGMSPGERARKSGAMWQFITAQITLAQQGMDEVLVNLDGFYAALTDWARLNDITSPERYLVDPRSQSAQKALQTKSNNAKEMQQMQTSLMTQAVQIEQMRIGLEKYSGDADRQFQYWNAILGSEVEEAKIAGDATVKLLVARKKPGEDGDNKSGSKSNSQKPTASNAA
jgi:hypothetical protein